MKNLVKSGNAAWAFEADARRRVLVDSRSHCRIVDARGRAIVGPKRQVPTASSPHEQDFSNHLKDPETEGFSGHMYLDTEGHVTVGYGHFIANQAEAVKLTDKFVFKGSGKRADRQAVEMDFRAVKNSGLKGTARLFGPITALEMPESIATLLLLDDIDAHEGDTRRNYPHFDSYPLTAKLALLDMVYTLGIGKTVGTVKGGFPRMTAAIRRRDWKAAAKESEDRKNVGPRRQKLVRDWFRAAAHLEPHFVNEKCTVQLTAAIS
ncbi:MAG: hypothetical protein MI920_22015 [Kiloniellales bacterium]|nr:hypothetical protein [Kiloniellales bacterium]